MIFNRSILTGVLSKTIVDVNIPPGLHVKVMSTGMPRCTYFQGSKHVYQYGVQK